MSVLANLNQLFISNYQIRERHWNKILSIIPQNKFVNRKTEAGTAGTSGFERWIAKNVWEATWG